MLKYILTYTFCVAQVAWSQANTPFYQAKRWSLRVPEESVTNFKMQKKEKFLRIKKNLLRKPKKI